MIEQLDRLCLHKSGLGPFATLDWRRYQHLSTLIVQCEAEVPAAIAERLPRAIWIRNQSTSRAEVGFDLIKPPRKR